MPYYHQETIHYLRGVKDRIEKAVYQPISQLKITAYWSKEPIPFQKRTSGKKISLKPGQKWGELFDCAWFNFTGVVPKSAKGKKVVLLLDVNGEMCIFDKSGNPIRGLTNVSSTYDFTLGMPGKRVLQFLSKATGGEKVDIWADAGCNDLFGVLRENGTVKEASIAICNDNLRDLFYDFSVLYELMTLLPEDRARYHTILEALKNTAFQLREFSDAEAITARKILAPELAKKNGDVSLSISAVGHSHIDLGWLWPIRETIRKGVRTFSTVLDLMNQYPDYIFGASQPQLYEWMKSYYPALYKKIKKRIAEGRWEPQGAMWVESDTNIPCGESLVRQLLYGKRFFKQEFGKEMKILWIPDVFGYSGVLPQLMKQSGVDYFMTQKMSWNIINRIPHHTFFWQGIDGSRILTHMPPEETYNSSAAPRALMKSENNFADKSVSDRVLILFGIGDGGGGPGPEHLERLNREKNLDGLPPCKQEPAFKFFKRIEKNQTKYQTWIGELYLERHQGTLTTQGRIKRANRKIEIALRELELTSILTNRLTGLKYPQKELDLIWKEVLLYQFHDILPGSSISRVYEECHTRYQELFSKIGELQIKADTALIKTIDSNGMTQPFLLFNSLSWARAEWLKFGNKWVYAQVPAMGYAVLDLAEQKSISPTLTATTKRLENEFLKLTFVADGSISSIFDKETDREILKPGTTGNQLNVYDDTGDAWDFYIGYDKKPPRRFKLQLAKVKIDGPKVILHQTYTFGKSKLKQDIILTAGGRRIDFVTRVDWQETHKMFRVAFPIENNAKEATCNIQFGEIKRPTHRNTSWDLGMFEIPAQKWLDISQEDYGVALLNDCKYGYKVVDNILDLNLLRSPTHPDPQADKGTHEFIYSLYPHHGNHNRGNVAHAGYELNVPIRIIPIKSQDGKFPVQHSFFNLDAENIIIETVKKAEDSDTLILRLYENRGATTKATLQFNLPIKSVKLVNLMEEESKQLKVTSNSVSLQFHPFEILTLKVE